MSPSAVERHDDDQPGSIRKKNKIKPLTWLLILRWLSSFLTLYPCCTPFLHSHPFPPHPHLSLVFFFNLLRHRFSITNSLGESSPTHTSRVEEEKKNGGMTGNGGRGRDGRGTCRRGGDTGQTCSGSRVNNEVLLRSVVWSSEKIRSEPKRQTAVSLIRVQSMRATQQQQTSSPMEVFPPRNIVIPRS